MTFNLSFESDVFLRIPIIMIFIHLNELKLTERLRFLNFSFVFRFKQKANKIKNSNGGILNAAK